MELPEPTTDRRRPFRVLEASLDDTIARCHPRADVDVDGDRRDELIGDDTSGTSPRATVSLIGNNGSLIRGGTLIGDSGMRAPLEPVPPSGSGGAPVRGLAASAARSGTHDPARHGAWDDDLDHDLLLSLATDRERLVEIARALGACPECWGERIGCARCGGVGRPGSEDPAVEAFDWYVRPLLQRLDDHGELRTRPRPAGSEAHPAGRGPSFWVDPD
jgi:hypothetical protein